MITSFNPAVARTPNCRQNNVNFQRDLWKDEIQGLKEDEDTVINDIADFIHVGHIKKEDLSPASNDFLSKNQHLFGVKYVTELLNKHAKK